MNITFEWITQLAAMLVAAGAVYGAIRADIKHIHKTMEELGRRTESAHERLDRHLEVTIDRRGAKT